MGQQYLGEIRLMGFNFAPKGWAFCAGQLLPIAQNQALFAVIGTYYGGDGRTTFALPDLRGRVANSMGTPPGGPTYNIGQVAGVENVTLLAAQLGAHTHALMAVNSQGGASLPNNKFFAQSGTGNNADYASAINLTSINPASILPAGSNAPVPHTNIQPYLALNYCIALQGIFPSRG